LTRARANLLALVVAVPLFLTGCAPGPDAPEVERTAPAPLAAVHVPEHYTVYIDSTDVRTLSSVREAVAILNRYLGFVAYTVVEGPHAPADWAVTLHVVDDLRPDIAGAAGGAGTWCDVAVQSGRGTATWVVAAHELLHCADLEHDDDPSNLLYWAPKPTSVRLTREQVAQARAYFGAP
jgi:hypothetical protein